MVTMKLFTTILLSLGTLVLSVKGAAVPPSTWISVEDVSSEFNGNATSLNKREGAELITCYNAGTKIDRASSIASIDDFCAKHIGQELKDNEVVSFRYDWGSFTILISGQAVNGCSFTIDNNCNRLLRKPLDECNTGGENGKQGGFESDICSTWRFDPGSNGGDA
ncbi:hypothetical protein Hypma_012109 [Hypsizygus marmoreus]|uniref:Ecp2 effector protein domain-containing protein n=1 Tax=Hypsizygus marmoreus TaxID=39966 RepID=A0A369JMX3_HYPMA|nr:hypothetical protein Hypma_012109 [Hypsizygus marmoreus]